MSQESSDGQITIKLSTFNRKAFNELKYKGKNKNGIMMNVKIQWPIETNYIVGKNEL